MQYAENLGGVGDGELGRYLGPNGEQWFGGGLVRDNILPRQDVDGIGTQERLDVWAMMVEGDIQWGDGPPNLARVREALEKMQRGENVDGVDAAVAAAAARARAKRKDNAGQPAQAAQYRAIADAIRKAGDVPPDTAEQRRRRRVEREPSPATPPKPQLPTISDEDKRFAQVRGRLRAENMDVIDEINAGKIPDREKLEGAIADLDKMIERYNRRGRAEKLGQAQRVKNALEQVLAEAGARDQAEREAVTPEGRTQAVENIADAIADRAAELRKNRERAKAKKIEDAADDLADALDRAEEAHNAGNKEDRDAALFDADDAAAVFEAEGENVIGDQVKRDIQGNRNRFSEDDNRVPPMERQEGIDRVADKWEEVGRRLRAEGAAGRKKRREYQDYMDEFDDAIDEAEAENRRRDENARDQNLKNAERMVEQVRQLDPELADVMEEVLAGQRERILSTDNDVEVAEIDSDSPSAQAIRAAAQLFQGSSKSDIMNMIRRGSLPDGVELDSYVGSDGGNINGKLPVLRIGGRLFLVKDDQSNGTYGDEGAIAEDQVSRVYRALGFNQPLVQMINPGAANDAQRRAFLMEFTTDPETFPDLTNVAKYGPSDPTREAFEGLLANTILAQSDRHGSNIMQGVNANGETVPVFIDNGLMLFNSEYGRSKNVKRNDPSTWLWVTPAGFAEGRMHGNYNSLTSPAARYARGLGDREAVKNEMVAFAQKMRDRAERLALDEDVRGFIVMRAQWIIDNSDEMAGALR